MPDHTPPPDAVADLGKGIGDLHGRHDVPPAGAARLGWNLLREDVSLPAAVLYTEHIEHNLHWMQRFAAEAGVRLAPHGKTTMAPQLFRRQLDAGAWGITLATAPQTRDAYLGGVRRVLMANQLTGRANMALIAGLLADPAFEFYCLVDSADGVDPLGRFFADAGRMLPVLLELGVPGGRTGVRDDAQRDALLAALARWRHSLRLAGVEFYEGVLHDEAAVRAFVRHAVDATCALHARGAFARTPVLLSGAGSAWYDVVADELPRARDRGVPVEIVLRPGCYLTHDAGLYREAQQRIDAHNPIARRIGASLQPALQIWAYVQSIPEANRAIVGFGKRDTSCDAGFPLPAQHYRPGAAAPVDARSRGWEIFALMDQHAFMRIAPGDDLRVGDMLAFDVSHPCLTFDKWRQMLLVDACFDVVEVVATFF